MQYLSPEWIEAAGRALASDPSLKEATSSVGLTLEHVVTEAPDGVGDDGTVRWHVRVDHGEVALVGGPAEHADVRFTTDYATAAGVAAGRVGAQRAFADGRLTVGGDVLALAGSQKAFAAVQDTLAGLRSETTFPAVPSAASR